ncbi:MAG: glycosyltransferase [Prolixibacteraceae bacterium]|nr:glycosyltransferase [Prolixibacteraceae bacterium]
MEISVIIPVFNAEKYVAKAVASALQFPEVKEVLLIEDGSPDNAIQVCRNLAADHDRVKFLQHPDKGNHGAGASRNLGLQNTSYPFIAFLDADDFFLPNRFEADKKVFTEIPNADGVYNAIGVHYYDPEAQERFCHVFPNQLTTVLTVVQPEILFPSFIHLSKGVGYFSLDGLTIKKDILKKIDYCFNDGLRLHQDTEFRIRLAYYARLFPGEISYPAAMRGVHSENRIARNYFDKKNRNINQEKLWISLYEWAKKDKIPDKYLKQIGRIKVVTSILAHSYFVSWFIFIKSVLKDRNILIKPVFYNQIHDHLFGRNQLSRLLLKIKNKIQRILHIGNNLL